MGKHLLKNIASVMMPLGMYTGNLHAYSAYSRQSKWDPKPGNSSLVLLPVEQYQKNRLQKDRLKKNTPQINSSILGTSLQADTSERPSEQLAIQAGKIARELVIIDANVPDKQLFFQHIKPGVDIIEIKANQDGLMQLAKILSNYHDLDALHLISHADNGVIYLGNSQINELGLKQEVSTLSALNNALKDNADLLLYGCNLARDAAGESLLELISTTAHVDVAASNNLTGAGAQSSDWDLEIQIGDIEADKPFSEIALRNFGAVLAAGGTIDMTGFTSINGYGKYRASSSYNFNGYTLELSGNINSGRWFSGVQYGYGVYVNAYGDSSFSKVYFNFSANETFDATSIYVFNSQDVDKSFKITSDKGDVANSSTLESHSGIAGTGETVTLTGFTGISKLIIENSDGSDLSFIKIDDVVVTNVTAVASNASPTDISISSTSVNQSSGINASVGTLTSSDADAGDSHIYSLISGSGDTDNDSFSISGSTLTANNTAALATGSYSVLINTNDGSDDFSKSFTITVTDDVAPELSAVSIANSSHKVGDAVTTTITVAADSDDYTTGSGGISGTINGYTLSGLTKLSDTQYSASFTVTDGSSDVDAGDAIAVNLTLTDSIGNTSSGYTAAISQDNDAIYANLPEVSLTADTNTITEDGGAAILSASLSGSLNNQWPVDISVGLGYSGTATITTDYTGAASITIAAGSSNDTTTLTGIGDSLYDAAGAETIIADISSVSVGSEGTTNQQTISITDAQSAPTVTLSTSTDTLAENGGSSTVTASLSHATYETVTVDLAYSGTATGGTDYTTPSAAIIIAAGDTAADTSTGLASIDDAEGEGDETIILAVSAVNGGGASENGSQQQTVTISDDEDTVAPLLSTVSIPNSSHKVGDTVTATITVASDSNDYSTGSGGINGTINGYLLSGLTKISDSQYSAKFTVTDGGTDVAAGDAIAVNLTLTDSAGNTSSAYTSAISQSSDAIYAKLPEISLTSDNTVIAEDGGVAILTASITGSLNNQWPVDISVGLGYSGTATLTTDYTGAASMTITPGNLSDTTTITGIGDSLYDAASAETIIADINTVSVGSKASTSQQTISITDTQSAPTVTLNTSADTLSENGGSSTVTASLSHATYETVTVVLAYSGTATSGTDYATPSAAITIAAGNTAADASSGLSGIDDADGEGDETIILAVSAVSGGGASENGSQLQTVTIIDDEDTAAPQISTVSIPNSSHKVGDTVTATITVAADNDDYTTGSGGISGTINGYPLSSLTKISDTQYRASFTVTDGGSDVDAGDAIAVNLTLTDSTGNSSSSYTASIAQSGDAIYANLPKVSLTADTDTIAEDGGAAILTASVSGSLNNQWPVDISVGLGYSGTATIITDYTGAASITIAPGSSNNTTTLTGIGDSLYDAASAETIIADISSVSVGSEGTTTQQTISITDAQSAPTVTLSTSTHTLAENGGSSTVTATLSHATYEPVTVDLAYSGTATSGTDYTVPSSAITIAGGHISADASTGLSSIDDIEGEGDETITLAVSAVSGGGASENGSQLQTVTITDDEDTDAPLLSAVSIPNSSHKVGDTVIATIAVATDSDDYTTGSGGISGTINGYPLSGLTKISGSQYSARFTITDGGTDVAAGDAIAVNLTLTDSAGNSSSSYTASIAQSGDAIYANLPKVSLTADTDTIAEDGGAAILTASVSGSLNNQWPVDISVGLGYSGTATITSDYTGAASITIAAGSSNDTTTLTAIGDSLYDAASAETIIADISSVSVGSEGTTNQQTISITDAQSAPSITLSTSTETLAENGGSSTVTATLSHATYETVTVDLAYSGTATSGTDYMTPSSAITIVAGDTAANAGTGLSSIDDADGEGDETIILAVSAVNGGGASESGSQLQTVTITDDEDTTAPQLSAVSIPNSSHKVGDTVTATITVPADSDDYTTGSGGISGTINDYPLSGLTKISGSQYSARFTITDGGTDVAAGDAIAVNMTLTDSAGNTSSAYTSAISQGNDAIYANLPEISLTADNAVIAEDGGAAILTASVSGSLNNQWPVDISVGLGYSGTATITTDYTGAANITIAAGSSNNTTTLTGIGDSLYDAASAETIIADISSVSVGSEGTTNQQTISITDTQSAPTITLTTSTDTLAEDGGSSIVTATLSHATYEAVTVDLAYSGTATSGTDYLTPSSAITIAAGNTAADASTGLSSIDDADGEGDETIILSVSAVNGGEASESGIQLQTVTISDNEDITPPSMVSIAIVGTPEINDSTVTYKVLFDEPVQALSVDDFTLTKTATATATIANVAASSGNDIAITLNNVSGTGSLRLDLNANSNITDIAGNGNNTFGYVAQFNSGDVHNVDRDAPTITNIIPSESAKANDTSVIFTVDFDDAVNHISSDDFKLTSTEGNAAGTIATVSTSSGTSVAVSISNISGTGSIRLDYNGTDLSDEAGNPVPAYNTGTSHAVDLDFPVFDSVKFVTDPVVLGNQTAASFKIIAAEINATADYTISSSGGGTKVTGSTIITTPEQAISNIDLSGLKDGILILAVKLTDIAGNESQERSATVNKDATAAIIDSVTIKEGHFKEGDTVAITVLFDDAVSVSGSDIRLALDIGNTAKQVPLTTAVNNKLIFSYTVKAGDTEPNGLLVEASSITLNGGSILDLSGNNADLSFNLVANSQALIDTTKPSAPQISKPAEHVFVNADDYKVSGMHVENDVTIKLYLDNNNDGIEDSNTVVAVTKVASGTWSMTPMLTADSDNNFVAVAEDLAGNRSVQADVFTITEDSIAPAVPVVTLPSATISTNEKNLNISGTHIEDEISIKLFRDADVDGIPDNLDVVITLTQVGSTSTTQWDLEADLIDNSVNEFVAIAYDKAGNVSSAAQVPTIIADTVAPIITVDALTTGDSTPVLTGTIDDMTAAISVDINGESYAATNNGDGTWSIEDQIRALAHGTYVVTVRATDIAGNANTEPSTGEVAIDVEAPIGHSVNIEPQLIDKTNDSNFSFMLANAELQAKFTFQVSDGNNTVSGNGQVISSSQQVNNIDVSGLNEGTLTLAVTLTDDFENSSPAVTDTVLKHYNKTPKVRAITASVEEDVSIKLTPQASDANGDNLTYHLVTQPQHGTLSALGNGWLYSPDENFNGIDNFNYKVNDGDVDSEIAQATITVTAVNDAPDAIADTFTLSQTLSGIYSLDVLVNDQDIDGDQITLEAANASIGQVSIVNNVVQYQADGGFTGTVRLEYVISDNSKSRANAEVLLTIEGLPKAQAPVITLPENIDVNANALYTKVDLGIATAHDFNGQLIPVSLVNGITHFPPGEHEVYWQASDSNNARTIASQSVRVHPLISLSKDQTVSESQQVTIQVILNGPSPDYPVEIPYSVGGNAIANLDHNAIDGVVMLQSGTTGEISFDVLADNEYENTETITISLDEGMNIGSKNQTNITISNDNIAPNIALSVSQSNEHRHTLSRAEGQVQILAKLTDPNASDSLSYQWTVSDGITIENEQEIESEVEGENGKTLTWTFEPSTLTAGVYKITLTAADDGSPALDSAEAIYLEVKDTLAILDSQDSDGDLIPDDDEGYTDQDGDGIPDYQDAISDCSVVPEQVEIQNTFLVEGDPGVCLRKGAVSVLSAMGGLQMTIDEIEELLGKDDDVKNIGGYFDYIAYGLPEKGQTYKMVFPQRLPIPANAVYRKYNDAVGWTDFVLDADNIISSTQGSAGYCPPPGGAVWQEGLTEGHWCVQLQIKDGGPNDTDGEANGTIVDPGGVGSYVNSNNLPLAVADTDKVALNATTLIDVLANDSDIDGDNLSILNATADFGQVSINNDNTLTYTPNQGFLGIDHIDYSISDNNGGTATSQVSVTVSLNTHAVITNKSSGGSVSLWWIISCLGIVAVRRRTLLTKD